MEGRERQNTSSDGLKRNLKQTRISHQGRKIYARHKAPWAIRSSLTGHTAIVALREDGIVLIEAKCSSGSAGAAMEFVH